MERYAKKQIRAVPFSHVTPDIRRGFKGKFDLEETGLKEWLREKMIFLSDY